MSTIMSAPLSSIQRSGSLGVPVSPSANREEQFLRIAKIVLPIIAAVAVLLTFPPVLSIPLTIAIAAGAIYFHRKSSEPSAEPTKVPQTEPENPEAEPPPYDEQVTRAQSEPSEEPPPRPKAEDRSTRPVKITYNNRTFEMNLPKPGSNANLRQSSFLKLETPMSDYSEEALLPLSHAEVHDLLLVTMMFRNGIELLCRDGDQAQALVQYLQKTKVVDNMAKYEVSPLEDRFTVALDAIPREGQEKATAGEIQNHLRQATGYALQLEAAKQRVTPLSRFRISQILQDTSLQDGEYRINCDTERESEAFIHYAKQKGVDRLASIKVSPTGDGRLIRFTLKSDAPAGKNLFDVVNLLPPKHST